MQRLNDAADPGQFSGRLDLSHAGAFGHSLGGVAAVQASAADRRLRAVANLDGGTGEMSDNVTRNAAVPVLVLTKAITTPSAPSDQILKTWGYCREPASSGSWRRNARHKGYSTRR
jgi:dienelactone hydrolase